MVKVEPSDMQLRRAANGAGGWGVATGRVRVGPGL